MAHRFAGMGGHREVMRATAVGGVSRGVNEEVGCGGCGWTKDAFAVGGMEGLLAGGWGWGQVTEREWYGELRFGQGWRGCGWEVGRAMNVRVRGVLGREGKEVVGVATESGTEGIAWRRYSCCW